MYRLPNWGSRGYICHMLPIVYTLALGLFAAAFVEIGIYTLFREPIRLGHYVDPEEPTDEEREFREEMQELHDDQMHRYEVSVTVASLVCASALFYLSLTVVAHWGMVCDAAILGAVFTLICAIAKGLRSENRYLGFAMIVASLLIVLVAGYEKYARNR